MHTADAYLLNPISCWGLGTSDSLRSKQAADACGRQSAKRLLCCELQADDTLKTKMGQFLEESTPGDVAVIISGDGG